MGLLGRDVPVAVVDLRPAVAGSSTPIALNLWALPRTVLSLPADDHVTLLVPLTSSDPKQAVEVALRMIEEQQPQGAPEHELLAGIGAPRHDLHLSRDSWSEALLSSRVALAVPGVRPVATWTDLGIYRLLACGTQEKLSNAILDPAVIRLLEHGDRDLLETAAAFLEAGGHVRLAAQALNIHRQTVYYRIQRIEQITGLSMSRGQDRLLLNLGLTMAPLLTSAG